METRMTTSIRDPQKMLMYENELTLTDINPPPERSGLMNFRVDFQCYKTLTRLDCKNHETFLDNIFIGLL